MKLESTPGQLRHRGKHVCKLFGCVTNLNDFADNHFRMSLSVDLSTNECHLNNTLMTRFPQSPPLGLAGKIRDNQQITGGYEHTVCSADDEDEINI